MGQPTVTGTGQTAYVFDVEIVGFYQGGVTKVSATDNVTDVINFNPGESGQTYATPGLNRPGTCGITKDWTNTPEFLNWYKTVQQGMAAKVDVVVKIYDNSGNSEVSSHVYHNCWPYKWTGPTLNSRQTGHAEEHIEFTWETRDVTATAPKV